MWFKLNFCPNTALLCSASFSFLCHICRWSVLFSSGSFQCFFFGSFFRSSYHLFPRLLVSFASNELRYRKAGWTLNVRRYQHQVGWKVGWVDGWLVGWLVVLNILFVDVSDTHTYKTAVSPPSTPSLLLPSLPLFNFLYSFFSPENSTFSVLILLPRFLSIFSVSCSLNGYFLISV